MSRTYLKLSISKRLLRFIEPPSNAEFEQLGRVYMSYITANPKKPCLMKVSGKWMKWVDGPLWWNFENETAGKGGAKWPALSPKYATWKKKHFGDKKMLVLCEKLKKAVFNPKNIRVSVRGDAVSAWIEIPADDVPYAARHNKGLSGMPKRTFLTLGPKGQMPSKVREAFQVIYTAWMHNRASGSKQMKTVAFSRG